MQIPRRLGRDHPGPAESSVAAQDASWNAVQASRLLDDIAGSGWYEEEGNDVDRVAYLLCRLRRAGAGDKGGQAQGDEAVREVLRSADLESLVWLASRAVSYMDETGFPEAVERMFPDDVPSV